MKWLRRLRSSLNQLFVTYWALLVGVGALVFHGTHGPGHLVCILGAGIFALGGGFCLYFMGRLERGRKEEHVRQAETLSNHR